MKISLDLPRRKPRKGPFRVFFDVALQRLLLHPDPALVVRTSFIFLLLGRSFFLFSGSFFLLGWPFKHKHAEKGNILMLLIANRIVPKTISAAVSLLKLSNT